MKIRRKKRNLIDIADSGALSDLAFLLIVFFIVIAVFNINKGFLLELPEKNSNRIVSTDDLIRVDISNTGLLTANGSPVEIRDIEKMVAEIRKVHPNMTFALIIHPEAKYQCVVEVVELVRQMEVENFSISMMEDKN